MTSVIAWSGQLPCAWAAGEARSAALAVIAARREILDAIGWFPLLNLILIRLSIRRIGCRSRIAIA
jgi:hypothetical protein